MIFKCYSTFGVKRTNYNVPGQMSSTCVVSPYLNVVLCQLYISLTKSLSQIFIQIMLSILSLFEMSKK